MYICTDYFRSNYEESFLQGEIPFNPALLIALLTTYFITH